MRNRKQTKSQDWLSSTPERDIQALILSWLKASKYFALRIPVGAVPHTLNGKTFWRKSPLRGFPDILGILKNKPGQMFCVECKSKNGRLSDDQKVMIEALTEAGVEVIIARSLFDLTERLKEIDHV